MIVAMPGGTAWQVKDAPRKLALRANLPGARVFDLNAQAQARAKAMGLDAVDRIALALPASWLVNSPAISPILKRWALGPQRDLWLTLIDMLDGGPGRWTEAGVRDDTVAIVRALGDEPHVIESISKVLALLAPDVVPLMPPMARAFVLGEGAGSDAGSFAAMLDWFTAAVREHRDALVAIARDFAPVTYEPAQVLDRILWFDSEGHRHFPPSPVQA